MGSSGGALHTIAADQTVSRSAPGGGRGRPVWILRAFGNRASVLRDAGNALRE